MNGVKLSRPTQRLTALIDQPGGRTVGAALDAAKCTVEAMRDSVVAGAQRKLEDVCNALAHYERTGQPLDGVGRIANQVNGLAGMAQCGSLGAIALALCAFLDTANPSGPLHGLTVGVYRRCLSRFLVDPKLAFAPNVVDGLSSLGQMGVKQASGNTVAGDVLQLVFSSCGNDKARFDRQTAAVAENAAQRNGVLDVSGILLAHDGWYLQCIEGRTDSIADLMASLFFDGRHNRLKIIGLGYNKARQFHHWATCCGQASAEDMTILAILPQRFAPHELTTIKALSILRAVSAAKALGTSAASA